MAQPHIQVILLDSEAPAGLRAALDQTAATASFERLDGALRRNVVSGADAVVLVVPGDALGLAAPLRTVFDRLLEHPRATLVVTSDGRSAPLLNHPPAVPVTYGSIGDEHDLVVRLGMMLEMRDSLDSLHRGMLANRRSGESVAKRYVNQLRMASQVQREFLPKALPQFGPVSFDVVFRPVDYVSGDIYDVHRLDEDHIGIAMADASGHGIPAALLTVYIKRALRGKEIENGDYRILSPEEVLHRLNEDILDAGLDECPFVAAVYAVLNTRTLEMRLARGGAPYPILRSATGDVRLIDVPGSVVGVLPDAQFEACKIQLQPGDSLLVYSDGLERIVAPRQTGGSLPESLRRAAEQLASGGEPTLDGVADQTETALSELFVGTSGSACPDCETLPANAAGAAVVTPSRTDDVVTQTAWCTTLREEGSAAALEQIAGRQTALRRMGYPLDDLTLLSICVVPQPAMSVSASVFENAGQV